ncbi:MAG: peptide chain release factor N(5)-glutamine methyltransferase [Oscillospiraceae bacterium]|nr:peptide chain release factor N(5)-glutamine methyltransferase [Oscillospiraceae bacterium]
MVKKLSQLYLDARRAFAQQEDIQTASQIARHLLCHIAGKTQEALLADFELYGSQAIADAMEDAVARVLTGEPLAYVLGEWDFYGMTLQINNHVLIPRDDTCAVTDLALKKSLFLDTSPRILDLCTGSGCIGLAIANKVKDARVTLADVSPEAIAVAKKNMTLQKLSARVSCVRADALKEPPAFLGKFDLIVSNPPYITTQEMQELPASVKDYEPHLALHGGTDGLDFYRAIAKNYQQALKPGGYLCFEFGMGQGDAVCSILEDNGYTILERSRDYNEIERAVLAQFGRKED